MGRGGGGRRRSGSPGMFSPVRSTSSASKSRAAANAHRAAGAQPTTPIARPPANYRNSQGSERGQPRSQQNQYGNRNNNGYSNNSGRANPMAPGGGFGGGILRTAGATMLGVMGASYLMNALRGHEGSESREEAKKEVEELSNGPCGTQFQTLLKCMEYNPNNVSNCQWVSDMFNNCQLEHSPEKKEEQFIL
eukprot:TRINITY_DN475_c3_g1_i1.p1 TRINITY_DN475_c3_g1~~TRINITY_DN475_c3_g1_i1.p1  ORF type:complete len:192 (-),score=77.85 TRINITY_DN475_c3_g1_i1:137-712(-)